MKRRTSFAPDEDLSDRIILSVRTKGFESEVEIPVPVGQGDVDAFVASWLGMMSEALKLPHMTAPTRNPNWAVPIDACIHCKAKPCMCAVAQANQ